MTGKRIETLDLGGEFAGQVILDEKRRPKLHDLREKRVHVRVSALLELARERESTPYVAVAIAGEIQTVVPAPLDGVEGRRILAMIPEAALIPGGKPKFFLVEGPREQPRLLPLELR